MRSSDQPARWSEGRREIAALSVLGSIVGLFDGSYRSVVRTLLRLGVLLLASQIGCQGTVIPEVEPAQGSFLGGDPLRIRGEGFARPGSLVVYVCQRAAKSVVVESDRLIRLQTPRADEAGSCDVTLQFSDGEEVVLRGAFRYREPEGDVPDDIFDKISRGASGS